MIQPYSIQIDPISITTTNKKYTGNDIHKILEFLYEENNALSVVWNVDEFISPILRLLQPEHLEKLASNKHKCYVNPYTIFYIPGKLFSIKKKGCSKLHQFYSLDQYFPDLDDEPENLTNYTTQLSEALQVMYLNPTKLTSPIAIYIDCMFDHLNLSAWDKVAPADILRGNNGLANYANSCAGKLWIEAYKIGYFEETFDYDIVSCFSSVAQTLIDTRYCEWHKTKQYKPLATYGFLKGQITINPNVHLHPFFYYEYDSLTGKYTATTPVGTWRTYITKSEYEFLYKWKLGTFEINDAWWGFVDPVMKANPVAYPLRKPLQHILNWKEHENKVVRDLAKRMANGWYGYFGQYFVEKDEYGQHYNPVWFAYISTNARLEVADWIYKNSIIDNVIHISVDGVLLDVELEILR